MSVLVNMKSGTSMMEIMGPMLILFIFSYAFTCETNQLNFIYNKFFVQYFNIKKIGKILGFKEKKQLIIEGKRCFKAGEFTTRVDNLFSDRFQAIWYKLVNKHINNDTIYSIKELAQYTDFNDRDNCPDEENKNSSRDIFIVDQCSWFTIDDDIQCQIIFNKDIIESGTKKIVNTIENIYIEIFSYKKSLNKLIEYVDDITHNYMVQVQNIRLNKIFIYTYLGVTNNNEDRYCSKYSNWEECEFNSFRTFNNLFFDLKDNLLDKLDFFSNNKEWYKEEGHPYTFGVGLTGPPGTGKTSVIKCIANKLNRHLIVIPLNKLKTQREFSECFFEKTYNRNNKCNSIDFKDKIIVFEDIDCMTDIVKERLDEKDEKDEKHDKHDKDDKDDKDDNTNSMLKEIKKQLDPEINVMTMLTRPNEDKITLSFLLNIIDGIRETPGRILIITSNDYKSLDKALVRPGRIDFTLNMKNASIDTIKAIFFHYYNYEIPSDIQCRLKENVISPAQLVSYRLESSSSEEFITKVLDYSN